MLMYSYVVPNAGPPGGGDFWHGGGESKQTYLQLTELAS